MKSVLWTPGRYVRKHSVSVLLDRYQRGEISVGDLARALRISLLHAKKLIDQAQEATPTDTPESPPKPDRINKIT